MWHEFFVVSWLRSEIPEIKISPKLIFYLKRDIKRLRNTIFELNREITMPRKKPLKTHSWNLLVYLKFKKSFFWRTTASKVILDEPSQSISFFLILNVLIKEVVVTYFLSYHRDECFYVASNQPKSKESPLGVVDILDIETSRFEGRSWEIWEVCR